MKDGVCHVEHVDIVNQRLEAIPFSAFEPRGLKCLYAVPPGDGRVRKTVYCMKYLDKSKSPVVSSGYVT